MVILSGGAAAACLAFLLPSIATAQLGAPVPRTSPDYNHDFEFPLPIIPVKQPLATYINPETGVPVDFYEVKITAFTKNLFPDLGDASLVGYDGLVPGPTFRVARGRETVIRFVNEYFRPSGVHLHGSYSRAAFDGWAEDTILPGQYKDYYYPNKQGARTLWYHDHAVGITAINGYSGQSGFYIIQDDALEASLDLPRGEKYDIPLLLTSRRYTATGNITDETNEQTSTYGDTFSVNGQILPHFTVEPRKYRFRLLNAAVSRTFNLSIITTKGSTTVPFYVVGSDCGFMSKPVQTESLVLSMSERWEIVIDFSEFAGEKLTLANTNIFADTNYAGTDKVMQFRVGGSKTVTSNVGNGPLPDKLVDLDLPTNKEKIDQSFFFNRAIGRPWTINGKVFSDVQNRILRNVPRGTTEKWLLKGAGGWSHPIHVHLIDFQILSREVGNMNQAPGRTHVTPYEAAAIKDVAVLGENEAVTVLAKFAPWDGVFMFHCHNNIHEDHDMMAAFNVSGLSDFGYPETIGFEDPMDPRFRAKPYTGTNIAQIEREVLPFFSKLNAYKDIPKVQAALDHYWASKKGKRSCKSATSTSPYYTNTSSPTTSPTNGPRPDGQCGPSAGGATCQPGYCCSKYGYCGTTEQYCSPAKGCQFGCTGTTGTAGTTATLSSGTPGPKPSSGPRPDGQCGPSAGGATCQPGYCCSKYGYCGTTEQYCSPAKGCQFGCTGTTPSSGSSVTPSSGPGATPTTTPTGGPRSDGRCGVSFGGATCVGSPSGPCCSEFGYCGITQAHCLPSNGCQSGCNAAVPSGTGDPTLGECGTQHGGKTCTDGNCCSKWGWCGVGDDYCGSGCQGGPCNSS